MKRLTIAIAAALLTAAATAQQTSQPPQPQCIYTQVTMPDGRAMTCVSCGSFTSCS